MRLRFLPFLLALATFSLPIHSNAQSYPPVFSSTATYVAGDLVQYGGNWYRAVKALGAHGPYPSNGFGSWSSTTSAPIQPSLWVLDNSFRVFKTRGHLPWKHA